MNVQLSAAQVAKLTLTKREKLLRLAYLIRGVDPYRFIFVFSNIEYMRPSELFGLQHPQSAFAVAAQDGILKDAGLTGPTVIEAMHFFDLTSDELHAFSCDCGGHISNEEMARRVEAIAAIA